MKPVTLDVTDYEDFCRDIKQESPAITSIFRDGDGFMALASNGKEVRITPSLGNADKNIPSSKPQFDGFFFGQTIGFKGTVSVPEYADFDLKPPPSPAPAEQPPAEEPTPA
jgi:hypothetical protein